MIERLESTKPAEKLPHRYNEVAHILGSFEELDKKVEKALEASRRAGGFAIGTRKFIEYIIGPGKISEEHY